MRQPKETSVIQAEQPVTPNKHSRSFASLAARVTDGQVRNLRVVTIVAAIAVLGFWFVYRGTGDAIVDPLWGRLAVVAAVLLCLALTYLSKAVRRHAALLQHALVYLLTAWCLVLTTLNAFAVDYAVGFVFTVAAVGATFSVMQTGIRAAFVYGLVTTAGVALVVARAPAAAVDGFILTSYVAVTAAVTCLAAYLRRRLYEELLASEQRFKVISDAAFEAIFLTDEGVVVDCNERAAALLNVPRSKLAGADIFEYIPPNHMERVREMNLNLRSDRYEAAVRRVDGTVVPVEVQGRTLPYHGRQIRVAAVQDITARKETERAMQEAVERAEALLAMKGAIIRNVSHELRTPLAVMLGYTEMLRQEMLDQMLVEQVPVEVRTHPVATNGTETIELVNFVLENGRRLSDVLNVILEMAELQSGSITIHKEVVDIGELAQQVADLHRRRAEAKGLVIDAVVPSERVSLLIDHVRLVRVLDCLVDNAVKFTSEGRVRVVVKQGEAAGGGEEVCVCVEDTGSGIDPEFLPRAFDEFTQESGGLTRAHGGLGVGLAIARQLIERLGGTIEVVTQQAVGSTFTVHLPRTPRGNGPA